jgi:hypothetical protein
MEKVYDGVLSGVNIELNPAYVVEFNGFGGSDSSPINVTE